MNEISTLFSKVNDADVIILEKGRNYHVRRDDSFELSGYYCTNTARKRENPTGLHRVAAYLKGKRNIVIDGNGATLTVHGKMTPFLFDQCENITLKNLTVDYACPTMAEFRVASRNGEACVLKINPECLFRVKGNKLIWLGEVGANNLPYWQDSYVGDKRYIRAFNPQNGHSFGLSRDDIKFKKIRQLDENTVEAVLKNKKSALPVGCTVQTRSIVRDESGALFQRCKNLVIEGLRVRFMHGLGMVSQFCENVTYKNCDFTPATGRTIASTADFFQFSGCKGNIVIENCKAWGAHDDYVNVHGTHLRIISKNNRRNSVTLRFMHPETWGLQAFEQGDEIEFIKWNTLVPYFGARVLEYHRINNTDIRLYLDKALPAVEVGKDVVENATCTPNLRVSGCDFGPTSGRGILCTTRGEVVIEGNSFCSLNGPALLIEDDCNFWFESGYTKNIVFRNNVVSACDYACNWEKAPAIRCTPKVINKNSTEFVHGKLSIISNTFKNSPCAEHCIWLEYLGECEILNNHFDAPYEIKTHCSGKITDENNTVKCHAKALPRMD